MAVATGEERAKESKKEAGGDGKENKERGEESDKEQEARKGAEGMKLEAKSRRPDTDESP